MTGLAARGSNTCISFAHVHDTVNTAYTMNTKILSGAALEKALAAKLEELLRGIAWLRGWQIEHVGGESDAGFDLLATVPLSGGGKAALCGDHAPAVCPVRPHA